jgi:hypothetical protein
MYFLLYEFCPEELRFKPKKRVLGEQRPLLKRWREGKNLDGSSGDNMLLKYGLCCIVLYYIY